MNSGLAPQALPTFYKVRAFRRAGSGHIGLLGSQPQGSTSFLFPSCADRCALPHCFPVGSGDLTQEYVLEKLALNLLGLSPALNIFFKR